MRFKYKKYGSGILRPVIAIEIVYRGTEVPYEVLVDSGADVCIFNSQIADILGIDIEEGERHEIAGVTGVSQPYYVFPLTLRIGGRLYTIRAGFLRNMGRFGYGVVGQLGFFENFFVSFDLQNEEITLKPNSKILR